MWHMYTFCALYQITFIWIAVHFVVFFSETMDYGYPQLVTPELLKEFIKIGDVKDEYTPKVSHLLFYV